VCNLVYWTPQWWCVCLLSKLWSWLDIGLPQENATWSCWPGLKTSSIFSKLALLCCVHSYLLNLNCVMISFYYCEFLQET
jgi:hypothetical protein